MGNLDQSAARPRLDPSDLYRSRLGAQREPLSKTTMSEMRAWREASGRAATQSQPDHDASGSQA